MAKHWDGKSERRLSERRVGWNPMCAEHMVIQESTREHRDVVCGKIAMLRQDHGEEIKRLDADIGTIRTDIKLALTWKAFVFFMGIAALIIGSGFSFFGYEIRNQRIDTAAKWDSIDKMLDQVVNSQTIVLYRLQLLDRKQDEEKRK